MANWVKLTSERGNTLRLNLDQALAIKASNGGGTEIVFSTLEQAGNGASWLLSYNVKESVEQVWALAKEGAPRA